MTLLPAVKSSHVLLRTHYLILLSMTIASYVATISESDIGVSSHWAFCSDSGYQKKPSWRVNISYYTSEEPPCPNPLYRCLICSEQCSGQGWYSSSFAFLLGSLVFWESVTACSMNINYCLFIPNTSSHSIGAGFCKKEKEKAG